MTWLYVPGISCPSAPASVGLNSESCSPSIIGERLAEASATWRGKEQQPQVWSRRWKQGGFIRLLSGLTCSPSTLDHGLAQFIFSLLETHARTTASPGSEPEKAEADSLPPKSAVSPKSAGLLLSSERTSRGMRTGNSKPSSRHWSGWATSLRQEYSARPPLETPCGASDCSSWPSASARDHHAQGSARNTAASANSLASFVEQEWRSPATQDPGILTDRLLTIDGATWSPGQRAYDSETGRVAQTGLTQQAEVWMAPQVPNGGRSTAHAEQVGNTLYHEGKKVQLGLESQAKNWSSPKASDPEKAGPNMRGSKGDVPLPGQAVQWIAPMASDDGQKVTSVAHQAMLCNQAASFRPPSFPDRPIAGGSMSSTDSPNSNQPSVKRKLNPIFVEALMRWPTGLSGFERQETAWTRWWALMPSFLSALVSASDVPDRQSDLFGDLAA